MHNDPLAGGVLLSVLTITLLVGSHERHYTTLQFLLCERNSTKTASQLGGSGETGVVSALLVARELTLEN